MAAVATPEPITSPISPVDEKTSVNGAQHHGPSIPDSRSEQALSSASAKSFREDASDPVNPPGGPIKAPFPYPLQTCKPSTPAVLTPEQIAKYNEVLAAVKAWTHVPISSQKHSKTEPITDDERMWLTRECLLRYLRATKWHVNHATKRLLDTLTWRREYGTTAFAPEYISPENETGKQAILGFDNEGRPCLYLNPSKQNTQRSDRQMHHLVFMLERAIDLMPPGQETIALLVNFKESNNGNNPTVSQGKQTLNILQGHYPERLGRALISELPWYVTTFFKIVSPFIDPVTRTKMKFNEPLTSHVPPTQLLTHVGGEVDFVYDHSVYWPALNTLSKQRREAWAERWIAAGKRIGESEGYLKGGEGYEPVPK